MHGTSVILIFDVGKTNKKLLLFNRHYKLVYEESKQLDELKDEDGFPCEDVHALTVWVKDSFTRLRSDERYEIKAVNFSAYGASFVCLDEELNILLPLYNYLKPFPDRLKEIFYNTYGGESTLAKITASPVLGNLNSGMQLYRIKYEKPEEFARIRYALHLPQYLSFILTGNICSDITSIGCHTNLWDFQNNKYHPWVTKEGIESKLAPLVNSDESLTCTGTSIPAGIGLHDSSAALIPYLMSFSEPFVLISTGTWCISLNPFNHTGLSDYELQNDCLCFLSYKGEPVKASRLFAGYEHEQHVKKLAEYFKKPVDYYTTVKCDTGILKKIKPVIKYQEGKGKTAMAAQSFFGQRRLDEFVAYEESYHQLIADIIEQQVKSTNLVLKGTSVKRIFADGGFSRNPIYMRLLAEAFAGIEVFAASVPQASALGAALVIHEHWNTKSFPSTIINLKNYSTHDEMI